MAYLTNNEYQTITGRDGQEASEERLKRASRLLDNRIGSYIRVDDSDSDYDGYKLPLDEMKEYRQDAVKNWVAWMTAALYENGDKPTTFQSIQLGRFSVTENEDDTNSELPEMVKYADMQLRDAGLINTHVRNRRIVTQNEWCL